MLDESKIVEAATPYADCCGIYFLVLTGRIVYVGQSVICPRKLAEHAADPTRPFDSLFIVQTSLFMLDDVEAALYRPAETAPQHCYRLASKTKIVETKWRNFGDRTIFQMKSRLSIGLQLYIG